MFSGVMPALITPLTETESLNEKALEKLIALHLSQGADGFYVGGATGEGLLLREEVRRNLCEKAIQTVAGKVPVIVHITDMNFDTTIRLAQHAEKAGASAISAVPPVYFAYGEDDIYEYYKRIAASVKIPLMIYYTPASGKVLSLGLLQRLFQIENITAIKWTMPGYEPLIRLKEMTNGEANIINGPDETLLCGLAAGCSGGIGTTYNFILPTYKAIYKAYSEGRMQEALKEQQFSTKLIGVLKNYRTIPATKALMEKMGIEAGNAAFPMTRYTAEEKEKLAGDMKEAGWKGATK